MLLKERLEKKEERSACRTNFKTFNNEIMNCNYRNCLKALTVGINGNRRYCDDECNYLERLEREKEKNSIKKKAMKTLANFWRLLIGSIDKLDLFKKTLFTIIFTLNISLIYDFAKFTSVKT